MKRLIIFSSLLLLSTLLFSQPDGPCLPDGITFTTQEEIDIFQTNYPNCDEIEGDVGIMGNDIFNLNGLNVLISIGGDLIIGNTSLCNIHGLEGLTSIGGSLKIGSFGGGVYPNDSLSNINALSGLNSIGDDLSIWHNQSLNNLGGLEGITSLSGGLFIRGNSSLTNLTGLDNLTSIDDNLSITLNNSLENLTGLDMLDSIGGNLSLYGNTILESLTGLENLVSIGGGLLIGQGLYNGSGNPALTSLNGLENLDTIMGGIYICYNESLSVCDEPFICAYLTDSIGNIEVHDNASGCDGVLELAYQCGYWYPCLTEGTYNFFGQGDIDYFALVYPGCTDLGANIEIRGYNIVNLDSLNVITSVDGYIKVSQTTIFNFSGFDNLDYIDGNLEVGYFDYWWGCFGNPNLVDFEGLGELDSIAGNFIVECNSALNNFNGLDGLISIGKSFGVGSNMSLTNLNGLEGLNSVGENVIIGDGGTYGPGGNYNLENLLGLGNLYSIGGGLEINGNNSLKNLIGLASLASINGGLGISMNDSLTSLIGLEELSHIGGNLSILNNPLLSNCAISSICEYLSDPQGVVNIYGNSIGCNNPSEIADSCGFTMSCLPYGNYYFTCQEDIDNFQSDYPACTDLNGNVEISGENINNLSGFSVVTSVEQWLEISNNNNLVELSGFDNLNSTGSLFIHHNENLESLIGLENLSTIDYFLSIWYNDTLSDISSLGGLLYIGDELRINSNLTLNSLSGLDNIDADSLDRMYITDNINLSECAVQSICDYLIIPGADVTINGNFDGCKNIQEVEEACLSIYIEDKKSKVEELVFYPNPVSTSGHIKGISNKGDQIQILLFSSMGTCLRTWQFSNKPKIQQDYTLDLSNLLPGIYLVKVMIANEFYTTKVIKR